MYNQKNQECQKLLKAVSDSGKKPDLNILKPNDFKIYTNFQRSDTSLDEKKFSLFKTLLKDCQIKVKIYEDYIKIMGKNPNDILRDGGYKGVINSDSPTFNSNNNLNNGSVKNHTNDNHSNGKGNELYKTTQTNLNGIKEYKDAGEKVIEGTYNDGTYRSDPQPETSKTNRGDDNFKKTNSNDIVPQSGMMGTDTLQQNEENSNKMIYEFFHVIIKNLEANGVTQDQLTDKINEIYKLFENKDEASKEEFINPFYEMLIEFMKITYQRDKEELKKFLEQFIDALDGDTAKFFDTLAEIFGNIRNYKILDENNLKSELKNALQPYKNDLLKVFKDYDNNEKIIDFQILRKIVNDLSININDDIMEYLIYSMKVKAIGKSMFDLNYEELQKILNEEIPEISDEFKISNNNFDYNNTNADRAIKKIKKEINNQKKNDNDIFEDIYIEKNEDDVKVIKKDNFKETLEKNKIYLDENEINDIYGKYKAENTDENYFIEVEKLKAAINSKSSSENISEA